MSINDPGVILFIGHLWPEPSSSAAGYRTMALLQAIINDTISDSGADSKAHWQLHFTSAAEKTEHCADLSSMAIMSHTIKLNDASFDEFIQQLQPDIVIYDRFITEEQFAPRVHEHCPAAINILDTQDLHFLRRARQKSVVSSQPLDLYTDDSIREIAAILRCDLSLIISSFEMQLLQEQFKISADLLHYCPFMLDSEQLHQPPSYAQRQHFVMIGNFLHPPNWDAVLWCYQSIWPLIRARMPQAEIHIYGAYPSEKVWQLHQPDKGFIIKGRADDAVKTLQQYRVNLAPLRFGAGIKGKIADGFIAGTPCVTTSIGQEGMSAELPWGGLTAESNSVEEIAHYALDLYHNAALWQQCQDNGRQIISRLFNEAQHAQAFINTLQQLKNSIAEHRKNNFYGQILRHNLYRSQYFMSKWIEAKNSLN